MSTAKPHFQTSQRRWVWVACIGLWLLAVGCGPSSRVAVTGEVRWASQVPVESGSVVFEPHEGTEGPRAAARIVDGRFEFDATTGPLPGLYSVHVFRDETNLTLDDPLAFARQSPAATADSLELTDGHSLVAEVTKDQRHFEFIIGRPTGR